MKTTEKNEHILSYKILYTVLILLVYIVGKNIPLYMINIEAYLNTSIEAEHILLQTISGDINKCSLFALGISPFMISNILVQVFISFRRPKYRKRISPRKKNNLLLTLTLIVAAVQAVIQIPKLHFRPEVQYLLLTQTITCLEMVVGAIIILWLCSRKKKYGIGGQSPLILVNIVEGIYSTVTGADKGQLLITSVVSMLVIWIMVLMENAEKRIPVQRISIHNIYSDKNYLAIKLNPIGVMPAMFASAFFMIPQMLLTLLSWIFQGNHYIIWCRMNMNLNRPLGIGIYILTLFALTIGFSVVYVNPKELTEQFLKSGDSLLGIHAGRDTRRYLTRVIIRISFFSATVMSLCVGLPMLLQIAGVIQSSLIAIPSSVMMLTGIWCNIYREGATYKDLEAYRTFI